MAKNKDQIYGGAYILVAGVTALLQQAFGWHNLWFLYSFVTGLLMIFQPWDGGKERVRRAIRYGGYWVLAGSAISAMAVLTPLGWKVSGPLYLIAGGLVALFARSRRAEER